MLAKTPFGWRAYVVDVHDADTLRLVLDTGFDGRHEPDLRLLGTYAPELRQPGGPEMRAVALNWVTEWTEGAGKDLQWPFWVQTVQTTALVEAKQRTTLGRFVATVWRYDGRYTVGDPLNDVVNADLEKHPEWGHGIGRPA